jgi:DNA-binding winged helix-turn-helix (wHTH) protein
VNDPFSCLRNRPHLWDRIVLHQILGMTEANYHDENLSLFCSFHRGSCAIARLAAHISIREGRVRDMSPEIFRFADFELDRNLYELRHRGRPLKLERIPMDLLFLLVDRRDHLVTREEILERIWGKGVFLDADGAINSAVRKIRRTLQDDPEAPQFVVTVPTRGYRFVTALCESDRHPSPGDEANAEETTPSAAPPIRYAKSGDVHIAYRIFGNGPRDIVMIPGTLSHLEIYWATPAYRHLLKRLTAFARVIMFDKRGQGLSDRVVAEQTLEERIDDVRTVMDAAGSKRATIY